MDADNGKKGTGTSVHTSVEDEAVTTDGHSDPSSCAASGQFYSERVSQS